MRAGDEVTESPRVDSLPFVSVCIPVRNGAKELPYTLTNLLRHSTYPGRVEVVIGDHGSQDRTAELVAEWPTVRRIPVEYRGPNRSMVRNRILVEARGEIVLFIDHDILVSDDWIATHVRLHQQFPGTLVAGMTFGKDFLRTDVDRFLAQLELSHIQTSHALLTATDSLADARVHRDLLGGRAEEPVDAGQEVAPWRFFWTCNVSARMSDIREVDGFDEAYQGWGLEDDDFAMQFRTRGKRMLFSREAWAFHVPHPVEMGSNLMSWRRNSRIMFKKHPSREFEYFLLHGREVTAGTRHLERQLRRACQIDLAAAAADAAARLVPPRGRRLCYLARDVRDAVCLGATDALLPYQPLSAGPWSEAGVRCWSLLGVYTPFEAGEIDETVLLVDALLLIERTVLVGVLCEVARVSRHVTFVLGPASRTTIYEPAVGTVREIAGLMNLRDSSWITAGSTHPYL